MGSWKTIAAQSITLTPHHSILSPQNFVFLSPPSQDFFFSAQPVFLLLKSQDFSCSPNPIFPFCNSPQSHRHASRQNRHILSKHIPNWHSPVSQLVQYVIVIPSKSWIVDLLTKLISRKSYLIQNSTGPMSQLVSKVACSPKGLEITSPTNALWVYPHWKAALRNFG